MGNKSKKFKKLNCSPLKKNDFSCYDNKTLYLLKNKWNKKYKTKKIKSKNPDAIWKQLKKNLSRKCKNEKCWIYQDFFKNELNKTKKNVIFAPPSPKSWDKNPNEWLSSLDIINVLRQYEIKFKNFKFIGPSPIDYNTITTYGECVWNKLCKFNLKNYIDNNYTKFGIVFNTDPHYLDGSHWVSLFIDIENKYIYYFDSTASRTPKKIKEFIDNVKRQANSLGIQLKYKKNTFHHQRGNSECGMYVLYIIISLLENKLTPEKINKKRISDNKMLALRKILFN
jgi:hypothetical protein